MFMRSRFTTTCSRMKTYNYGLSDGNVAVQSDLALTPAQMLKMTEQGIPVTPSNIDMSMAIEGIPEGDWQLPYEQTRGIDLAGAWEAEQDARYTLHKYHRADAAEQYKAAHPAENGGD